MESAVVRDPIAGYVKDLIGLKNGHYEVIGTYIKDDHGSRCWECRCSCGRIKYVREYDLTRRQLTGCIHCARSIAGQMSHGKKDVFSTPCDLTGQVFGCYTVLGNDVDSTNQNLSWICRCRCGRIRKVRDYPLRNGQSRGCRSCSQKLVMKNRAIKPRVSLEDREFRNWRVLSYAGLDPYGHRLWLCICKCGREAKLTERRLTKRGVNDGCISCYRSNGNQSKGELNAQGEPDRKIPDPNYLPTHDEIRAMCRKIREENGHSLAPDLR